MYFSDVIGQSTIKEKLINSIQRDRVSHAQLISGLPGSGGLALAFAFAQYLNCADRGEKDACGKCGNCVKMNKLIHPDVHFTYPVVSKKAGRPPVSQDYIKEWREVIEDSPYISYQGWMEFIGAENKQGNITVSECREIIKKCHMQPFLGGYKVFIIWLPEFLKDTGNVLLKILEEPPGDTVFLLVTENSTQILTTILSRTQQVFLKKLSDEEVSEGLQKRFDIKTDEANVISHLADGDFRKAIVMAQSGFENNYFELFCEWSRMCYAINPLQITGFIDKLVGSGREAQKNFLHYALHIFRESMLMKESLTQLNRLNESEKAFTSKFSNVLNRDNLPDIIEQLNNSYYYIERNANSKIVLLHLSLQMNKLLKNS